MKLGDTVLYTTANLNVRVGIIAAINSDGSVELCCLEAKQRRLEWHSNVKVTGALAGTEDACERWCQK